MFPWHEEETGPSFMRLYTNQSRNKSKPIKDSHFVYILSHHWKPAKIKLNHFCVMIFFVLRGGGRAHGRYSLPYLKLTMLTLLLLWYLPFCPSTDLFKATIIEQHIVLDICTVTGLCRVSVSGPQYFLFLFSFYFCNFFFFWKCFTGIKSSRIEVKWKDVNIVSVHPNRIKCFFLYI